MFKATLVVISTAALALVVCGCGVRFSDGPHTTQTRSVPAFDRVEVRGSADVVVHRGVSRTLTVAGGEHRVDDVVTRVQSGTLIVEDRGSSDTLDLSGDQLTVTVSTPRLTEARITGSGDLGDVVTRAAKVNISGSGDADVHAVRTLDAVVSGSGDVQYTGDPRLSQDVTGSGDVSRG